MYSYPAALNFPQSVMFISHVFGIYFSSLQKYLMWLSNGKNLEVLTAKILTRRELKDFQEALLITALPLYLSQF